jgi:subtilisin
MEFQRYIVLPSNGFRSTALAAGRLQAREEFLVSRPGTHAASTVRVLDQIYGDGPKLVEMTHDGEIALMREYAGEVRIVPLHQYERPRPTISAQLSSEAADAAPANGGSWGISVSERGSERPIMGATIAAFTNYRRREGVTAQTDEHGGATLALAPGTKVERLLVEGPVGYWGSLEYDLTANGRKPVQLAPIDVTDGNLALARFRGALPASSGSGVRIGIIDTGILNNHPNLAVADGRNCVFDELDADPDSADDWYDYDGHGSHVAGIVAGQPTEAVPFCGVAPGVELRAYRVFPKDGGSAINFDIMRAIEFAAADGCHIINLSLGGTFLDEAVRAALGDARGQGVLIVAAAGNNNRRPILYPAAYDSAFAVSALGVRGSFPPDTPEDADVSTPTSGVDKNVFLARFTNVGPQMKFVAPGVGVVSTVPGGFSPMSGTSMAAPMISGLAAALLSQDPYLLTMPAAERVKELIGKLLESAVKLGFRRDQEGAGLPLPPGPWRTKLAHS